MSERRLPSPHPDADQLNAFMAGALSDQARQESLAHLAECAECRSIVFLAQAAEVESQAKQPAVATTRRWTLWFALAGAAAAAVLLVALGIGTHPRQPAAQPEVAIEQTPLPSAPIPPAPSPERATPQPVPEVREHGPRNAGSAAGVGRARAARRQPQEVIPGAATAQKAETQLAENTTQQPAAPSGFVSKPTANPRAPLVAVQPAPAEAAAANLQANAPTPARGAAGSVQGKSQVFDLKAANKALAVRIEPNQGPSSELSAVSGTVTDPTGAIVPGARVSLVNASNATNVLTTTDANGQFSLADIAPGQYDLRVNASGFTTESLRIDLHAHDLAVLTPVLKMGASAQTVQVSADTVGMIATTPSSTDAKLAEIVPALPSKLPSTRTAVNNGRILALDQSGTLFLSRNAGKHWKRIKPVWPGAIAQLGLAEPVGSVGSQEQEIRGRTAPLFQITTTTGAVWLSKDGSHWSQR